MSSTATVSVPFESQSDPQNRRDCGAACLSMVYRSFGKTVTPVEIWPAIAKENRFGSISSTTHLMAKDALSRGFAAVAFQASSPLQALRLCNEPGIRESLSNCVYTKEMISMAVCCVNRGQMLSACRDPFNKGSILLHGDERIHQHRIPLT